jgi:hypothetical protein
MDHRASPRGYAWTGCGCGRRDPLDLRAELAQALVDALVAAVDLADVADLAAPSAQSAAMSIAIPARMSGDSTRSPRSRAGR